MLDTQYARLAYWKVIQRERNPHHIVTHTRRLLYRFRMHFHPYAERLMRELIEKDIQGLEELDTAIPELREEFFEALYKPKTSIALRSAADMGSEPAAVVSRAVDQDGTLLRELLPVKDLDFDYAEGAYAVYNWEVFFMCRSPSPCTLARTAGIRKRNGGFTISLIPPTTAMVLPHNAFGK